MIKQIKYISRFAKPMTAADIEALAQAATKKNAELGVTGVLLAAGGVFFQVLEGPKEAVDRLFDTIVADQRHEQVLLLGSREGVESRIFDTWAMGKVDLDASAGQRLEPLKAILSAVLEQRRVLDGLVGALERGAWQELISLRP